MLLLWKRDKVKCQRQCIASYNKVRSTRSGEHYHTTLGYNDKLWANVYYQYCYAHNYSSVVHRREKRGTRNSPKTTESKNKGTVAGRPNLVAMATSISTSPLKYKNTNQKEVLRVKIYSSPLFWSSGSKESGTGQIPTFLLKECTDETRNKFLFRQQFSNSLGGENSYIMNTKFPN